MNGKTTLPTVTWKEERDKLTNQQKTLNMEYLSLKNEVKEVEQIRKSVDSILRQEHQKLQPRRTWSCKSVNVTFDILEAQVYNNLVPPR